MKLSKVFSNKFVESFGELVDGTHYKTIASSTNINIWDCVIKKM